MRIAEIFYSLQGEGDLIGIPSIFVRTSGCNLRCQWCDTPYSSWQPEGKTMALEEILVEVHRWNAHHVVLTGGEPMLAPGLDELARALAHEGKHITIETAATLPPQGIPCDLASLSPKLRNSTPANHPQWKQRHEELRYQPQIIRAWLEEYNYQLKFVVCAPEDVEEIDALVRDLRCPIPPHKILLMPEGITAQALHQKASWLVECCKERGYRYAYRLHIELFGQTRGT